MTTFNKLRTTKLYGGEDQLIYSTTLGSNVADFTISGLDGDTDRHYRLEVVSAGGAVSYMIVQPNADNSASYFGNQWGVTGSSTIYNLYQTTNLGIPLCYGADGDVGIMRLFPYQNNQRSAICTSIDNGNTTFRKHGYIWNPNNTNITSLKIIAQSTTATQSATPTMTSNTAPSGVVSASEELRAAWKAFNKTNADANDSWASNGSFPAWLKYDFGSGNAKVITYLKILTCNYASYPYAPGAWVFQGSNDDSNWTDLASATNSTNTANTYIVNQAITNSTAYRYYRFYITTACLNPYVSIGEMEMTETYTVPGYLNSGTQIRLWARRGNS